MFTAPVVSVAVSVVLTGAKNLPVRTVLGGRLTAATVETGFAYYLSIFEV
jgi:hypothetical protein